MTRIVISYGSILVFSKALISFSSKVLSVVLYLWSLWGRPNLSRNIRDGGSIVISVWDRMDWILLRHLRVLTINCQSVLYPELGTKSFFHRDEPSLFPGLKVYLGHCVTKQYSTVLVLLKIY